MAETYSPSKWREDRMLAGLPLASGKYREAHELLGSINLLAEPCTSIANETAGMLLVLEVLRPESKER